MLKRRHLWASVGVLALLSACANILGLILPATEPGAALAGGAISILAACVVAKALWGYREQIHGMTEEQPSSTHLLTAQEEERKRLSRELHDGVGQIITAMKMELAHVKVAGGVDDNARLQRARSHADEALRTIRSVSALLRPAVLDDLGLKPALLWLTEDFSRRTSILCQLLCLLEDDWPLPEAVRMCVYRTVQEALNNCEKHSGAANVAVEVKSAAGGIQLSIDDDGRGFSSIRSEERGLGILGMRERAAMLGGSLEVSSSAGSGTRVTLVIPIANRAGKSPVRA